MIELYLGEASGPVQLGTRTKPPTGDAERFVPSIKEDGLERMILFGERQLRRTIAEFVAHYHGGDKQGGSNQLMHPHDFD